MNNITPHIQPLLEILAALPLEQKVEALNQIKRALHEVSPFKNEPVDCVIWVKNTEVHANDYNPNSVAPPEMKLLRHSITADGYTQPIVATPDEAGKFEVIDGFHRSRVGKECKEVTKRVSGYLPITAIKGDRTEKKDRMASTIRHNRARGVHGVKPMTSIVAEMITLGWTDTAIAKELGMDADEVLRFKQQSGLPDLFKSRDYSPSWE